MSIASDTVGFFQTEWADRFSDTCTIYDLTARNAINSTTLQYDSEAEGVVYTGGCLIRRSSEGEDQADIIAQEGRTFTSFDVLLPFDASTSIDLDNRLEVDSSLHEPFLVGKGLIVRAIGPDSYNTRRLVQCELDLGSGDQI